MNIAQSEQLFEKAKKVIPGGVNSPVRACRSVGCNPIFIAKAEGAVITDVDTFVEPQIGISAYNLNAPQA